MRDELFLLRDFVELSTHRGRIKGDSLRHDYVVPPPSEREALVGPLREGAPVVGGSRRRRVGENAGRVGRYALPRVILSGAKPEGQIALQFGSRERVSQELSKILRRSRPSVDPADFGYANICRYLLRSG